MCPQLTGMPLRIRPVTRGGYAGPVTMDRIARGPLSWTRPHCGMPSSPVFVWCRSSEGCPCLLCLSEQRLSSGDFERRVAFLPSLQQPGQPGLSPLCFVSNGFGPTKLKRFLGRVVPARSVKTVVQPGPKPRRAFFRSCRPKPDPYI
jgi:hypothetical protein